MTNYYVDRFFVNNGKKLGNIKMMEHYVRSDLELECIHRLNCGENLVKIVISADFLDIFHPIFINILEKHSNQVLIVLETVWNNLHVSRKVIKQFKLYIHSRKMIFIPNLHMKGLTGPRHENHILAQQKDALSIEASLNWLRKVCLQSVLTMDLEGVNSISMKSYLANYCDNDCVELLQRLEDSANNREEAQGEILSIDKVQSLLDGKKAVRGTLEVDKCCPLEGKVRTSNGEIVLVTDLGVGIHGDEVVVEFLDKNKWKRPTSEVKLVHVDTIQEIVQEEEYDENVENGIPTGKVVYVWERRNIQHVATVDAENFQHSDDYVLAVPMDIRIPKIRIRTKSKLEIVNKRLVVVIDGWQSDSNYPNGHYTHVLGDAGDLESEIAALLLKHEIVDVPFGDNSVACLPTVDENYAGYEMEANTKKRRQIVAMERFCNWTVPDTEIQCRRDIRKSHRIFSVDPKGCQDIDDAMSIRKLANGHYELGVHIADVTYFVKQDSPLDIDAKRRSTTVYLVDRRYDMLPPQLSADLCSLHCNKDRLAFTVFWELDTNFVLIPNSTWYGKTIIHSIASLTYDQASDILMGHELPLEGNPDIDPIYNIVGAGGPIFNSTVTQLEPDLKLLTTIARKLKKQRCKNGAVDLSKSQEVGFDAHDTFKLDIQDHDEIHDTIAELMILANSTVAEKIAAKFPNACVLRRHGAPTPERFDNLLSVAKSKNIQLDISSNGALQNSLDILTSTNKNELAYLKCLATLSMMEAEYVPYVDSQDTGSFHYGLGLKHYTHFTSPIRRYADILVHRLLFLAISTDTMQQRHDLSATSLSASSLTKVCAHINEQHRNAKRISRDCDSLFLSLHFRSHREYAIGIVSAIRNNGFIVYVPKFDIKGPVYLMDRHNNVQMNPKLIDVLPEVTQPASGAFTVILENRTIPLASLKKVENLNSPVLQVWYSNMSAPSMELGLLAEVTVQLSCDFSSSSARIPPVRFHFVSNSIRLQCDSETFKDVPEVQIVTSLKKAVSPIALEKSLYRDFKSLQLDVSKKQMPSGTTKVEILGAGRRLYGGYCPPKVDKSKRKSRFYDAYDIHEFDDMKEEMKIQRKSNRGVAEDAAKEYGRMAMSRQFRLQSQKRNDRIAKNKRNAK